MTHPWPLEQKHTWNKYRKDQGYEDIVLSGLNLSGWDLSDYHFMNVTFKHCSFERAKLFETNFRTAILDYCNFKDAMFYKTMFEACDLRTCFFNDWPVNCFTEGVIISDRQQKLLLGHFKRMIVMGKS